MRTSHSSQNFKSPRVGLAFLFLVLTSAFSVASGTASERIALVVGNNDYLHGADLRNAVSDSKLMVATLKKCGFEVIALENAGIEKFYEGLDQFNRKAASADVGLVYYAGHGVEVEGNNYLLPVDANLTTRSQLRTQAVGLNVILQDMEDADLPVKLAILDCCRDNPLKRSWIISRSGNRGLGALSDESLPEVSMVMYSARPGQVAYDGENGNSPFSLALSSRLATPGLNVFDAFYRTADDVLRATGDRQEPWVKADGSAQAIRRLVFVPESAPTPVDVAPGSDRNPPVTGGLAMAANAVGNQSKQTGAAPVLGNTKPEMEAPPAKVEVMVGPPAVPSRGYYSNSEIFQESSYEDYNSYAKSKILRSAQAKLPGAGSPDGQMGRKTQAAIMAYQAAAAISVTGVLDEATLRALDLIGIAEETYKSTSKKYSGSSGRSYRKSSGGRSGGGSLESRAAGAAARAVLGF